VLASVIMIAQPRNNSWSELLISVRPLKVGVRRRSQRQLKFSGLWAILHSIAAHSLSSLTCGNGKCGGSMTMRRLRDRFRRRVAGIGDSFSKLIPKIGPATQHFEPQRMCPFCGLITPRSRPSCLECGRSFGNAWPKKVRLQDFRTNY